MSKMIGAFCKVKFEPQSPAEAAATGHVRVEPRSKAEAGAGVEAVGRLVDSSQADDRKMIRLVRDRRLLYARNNMPVASYHSQVKRLWQEVANEMGWTVAEVRRKWSHIRNSYSRHLRNEMHGAITAKGRTVSRWYLADELSFLREHMATDTTQTTQEEGDILNESNNDQGMSKLRPIISEGQCTKKIHQKHTFSNIKNSNEQIIHAISKNRLSPNADALRQRRYYERHREEINKRKRDRRLKQNKSESSPATAAERARRYRERHKQKINEKRRDSRRLQRYVQRVQTEFNENNTNATDKNTIAIPDDQKNLNSSDDNILRGTSHDYGTSTLQRSAHHFEETHNKTVHFLHGNDSNQSRPSPYSTSYAPTFLEVDMSESQTSEPDVKPFLQGPWFSLGQPRPAEPAHDDSSGSAFDPEETSSYFQFFRGLHPDYQELSARKQRQFKRQCLLFLHQLLDEEDRRREEVNRDGESDAMNLSNSHVSDDDDSKLLVVSGVSGPGSSVLPD